MAAQLASKQQPKRLRILALHGGYQNAKVFNEKRTKDLQRRLRDIAEFVCLDGPILAQTDEDPHKVRRSWFNWDEKDPNKFQEYIHQKQIKWHRFEETCVYLEQAMLELGPFDGVLGFSQGGEALSVFVDQHLRKSKTVPFPRFLIFISSFLEPKPTNYPKYPQFTRGVHVDKVQEADEKKEEISDGEQLQTALHGSRIPSLHIWGLKDEYLAPQRSEALAAVYHEPETYVHAKGHYVPQSAADCKVFRKFLTPFLDACD